MRAYVKMMTITRIIVIHVADERDYLRQTNLDVRDIRPMSREIKNLVK